jgi:hypothetical protein
MVIIARYVEVSSSIQSPYMMIHIYWSCLSFRYADKLNYTLFIFLNLPFSSSSTWKHDQGLC